MTMYDVGDMATVTTELRDAAGTLAAADVALTVTLPDGTVLAPAPAVVDNGGTGLYKASFPLTMRGTWRYTWTASGAVVAVDGGELTVVGVAQLNNAAEYIGASPQEPLLARLLAVAQEMVDEHLGVEGLVSCPPAIRAHAITHLTSELYSRRNNPGGVLWAPGGDTAARLSRDALASVLPMLDRYVAGIGIA